MKNLKTLLALILLFAALRVFSQGVGINNDQSNPDPSAIPGLKSTTTSPKPNVIYPDQFAISAPLRDMVSQNPVSIDTLERNADNRKQLPPPREGALPIGPDPVWQKTMGTSNVKWNPTTNFEGTAAFDGTGVAYGIPPDTQGDVGPNHYVQVVNKAYQIWDKAGNSLLGPINISTIWSAYTPGALSDPIVLYDEIADRWFVSIFEIYSPYRVFIAVSTTADPTGSYYTWAYAWDGQPDYAKYGIWRDGYYAGYNNGTCTYDVAVFDRSAMLTGNASPAVVSFDNPHPTYGNCILPLDNDGGFASSGTPGQFIHFYDDAWPASSTDQLWIYTLSVNWSYPFSSTFSRTQTIDVASFQSSMGQGPSQPGTTQKLNIISNQMMYRAQYRKFNTHETIVTSQVVDVDNTDHGGIRWYELRRTGGNWWVYQEGTYAPDAESRFMCSIAMNGNGDMALGYSVSSTSVYPSIRYTGRLVSDPLNTMTIPEGEIFKGMNSQTGSDRWGDYSCMTVDPSDEVSFWYTNEYSNGGQNWRTRIAKINLDNPVYCTASGGCDEFISRVQMGSIDNSSACSGYADYTTLSTSFPANGSQQITITNGNPVYSTDECGIWVDWNLDGDFYDANEQISVSGTPGVGSYTATISPPYGVTEGYYTLRIRIKYNSGLDPCGTTAYGEVEDYSFELTPKVPNEWTGASNSYWNQAGNWSLGHIPTPDEDVIINNVGFQPPIISSVNEECNNLTIGDGAWVYVMETTLTTHGNMSISGKLSMVDDNGGIICYGNVDWNNNSTANFTANSLFQVYGHWFFNSGANAQLSNGTVNFIGDYLSEVKSKSASCSFNNIYIDKNYNALKIISDASQPLVINGDINIQSNSGLSNDSGQDIILRGNFYNSGYYYLADASYQSTFVFDGTDQYIFMFAANGYFNHLKINPSGSVTLAGGIHTAGDLIIDSGILDTQGNTIIVEGDWVNNVGPDAFLESTGRVIFSGLSIQYCSDEVFNILEVANPPGAVYISDANVVCVAYDWTAGAIDVFNGGVFTANDLIDNGIYGKYVLNDNSIINLTNLDGYVDLDGELYINGGTMNVYGGTTPSFWPYDADAVINMSAGVLDFHNQGIHVYDTPTYSLTDSITGGIVRTSKGFLGERYDFTPTGGTFEFYGPDDYLINQSNGCTLYNVIINKSAKKGASSSPDIPLIDERSKKTLSYGGKSNTTVIGSDFVITNNLTITSGELKLSGYQLTVNQDCNVYGTLTMDNNADVLRVGQNLNNLLYFHSGSVANLQNGTINNYGWLVPDAGCSFNPSTNNTIVFKGWSGGGLSNYEPTATYGNVILDKDAGQVTYIANSPEAIVVNGSFTLNGDNHFEMQNNTLIVHGNFVDNQTSNINTNSTKNYSGPKSGIEKGKSMGGNKDSGGYLEIDSDFILNGYLNVGSSGMAIVHGKFGSAASASLGSSGGSFIADSPNVPGGLWPHFNGAFDMYDGLFEETNNSIICDVSTAAFMSGGTIRCGEAFDACFSNVPGGFLAGAGVVELTGIEGDSYIHCPPGNFFHDLKINCTNGATMTFTGSSNIQVYNDLIIDAGHLEAGSASNFILKVGGNWTDNAGGFIPATGTVEFNWTNPSQILTNATFYNLAVDKQYTGTDGLDIIDGLNVDVLNNLNVNTGGMTVENSTLSIANDVNLTSDCFFGVPPTKTAAINVGGNWLNGNPANTSTAGFSPGMSTVTFNGTTDQDLSSNADTEGFYEFVLDNAPNVLYNYTNIECLGDFHAISGNMVDNYGSTSDGHDFWSDFIIEQDANVDFDSHILGFFGSGDATFWDASGNSSNSSNYGATIYINKDNPSTLINFMGDNATGLNIGSTIMINQGYVSPLSPLSCNGGIFVYGGTMHIGEAIVLSVNGIEVSTGGFIEIIGSAINPAMVKNTSGGSYYFDVKSGGGLRAENAVFHGMGYTGINIESGAYIDPAYSFTNCTFQDFINPDPSSSFLTIDNDQVFTIMGASFPDNSSAAYNIRKNNDQGQITLLDYSGVFSGEAFEDDPYNRVDWIVPTFQLDLTAFLEGPFNSTGMNTALNNLSMIPLTQPYNAAPWNYAGTESVAAIPNNQVVDWVLIEGRDAPDAASANASTAFARKAAFVLTDGSVVGLDGSSPIQFNHLVTNQLFVVVFHRNHFATMSANALIDAGGKYSYDFTTAAGQAYGDNQSDLGNGYFGLFAADFNADGAINNDDLLLWKQQAGKNGYLMEDANLDTEVNNVDKNDFWNDNNGKSNLIPQ